jgi:hypothetical protein
MESVLDAQAIEELEGIAITTHEEVGTIVHGRGKGLARRRGIDPASQGPAGFQELDRKALFGQGRRGRDPGIAPAHDQDFGHQCSNTFQSRQRPTAPMTDRSLSARERETLPFRMREGLSRSFW